MAYLFTKQSNHTNPQNLAKCREVNRAWQNYLEQEKFLHIKIIRSIVGKFHEVGDSWEAAFKTLNTENIRELGVAVKCIYIDENRHGRFGIEKNKNLTPTS